jgi:methionine-rich copper-binding protein CopC
MSTSRGERLRLWSVLAALALPLVVGGQLVGAGPAAAHDVLEETSPKDGSTVAVTPSDVTLTFDQVAFAVGSQVLVNGPSGNVAAGPVRIVDRVVHEAIQPGAPAGSYTVEWRVTSADGHPVSGKFTFTSQAAAAGTAPASGAASSSAPASSAGQGSSTSWVLPTVVLAVIWLGILFFFMRRRSARALPKPPPPGRRPGPPDGPDGPHGPRGPRGPGER